MSLPAPRALVALATLLALVATPATAAAGAAAAPLARAEASWAGRSQGRQGLTPAREPVTRAVAFFEEALAAEPESHRARLGLLNALYFLGEFVAVDRQEKLTTFRRGIDVGERGLALTAGLEGGGGDPSASAGFYFWTAVHWGLWGRQRGKLAAARQGVGGKIRDYSEKTIALDARYEGGGGHRLLGRLHAEAPRVPFFTGWVDRETAVEELEKALGIAPLRLENRLYLAEALLDFAPDRRDEALELLHGVASAEPAPAREIEDLHSIRDAGDALARHDG